MLYHSFVRSCVRVLARAGPRSFGRAGARSCGPSCVRSCGRSLVRAQKIFVITSYGPTFILATGFHGLHVINGIYLSSIFWLESERHSYTKIRRISGVIPKMLSFVRACGRSLVRALVRSFVRALVGLLVLALARAGIDLYGNIQIRGIHTMRIARRDMPYTWLFDK